MIVPRETSDEPSRVTPELLTTREAAELLRVGERTLWRWSRSGRAPRPLTLAGRTIRFRRWELEAWIAAGCPSCKSWSWKS